LYNWVSLHQTRSFHVNGAVVRSTPTAAPYSPPNRSSLSCTLQILHDFSADIPTLPTCTAVHSSSTITFEVCSLPLGHLSVLIAHSLPAHSRHSYCSHRLQPPPLLPKTNSVTSFESETILNRRFCQTLLNPISHPDGCSIRPTGIERRRTCD
jgi:hypothetical protein